MLLKRLKNECNLSENVNYNKTICDYAKSFHDKFAFSLLTPCPCQGRNTNIIKGYRTKIVRNSVLSED